MAETTPIPGPVARFRAQFRERQSPRYSGVAHAAFTFGLSVAVIAGALSRVHSPLPAELLLPPLGFLFGNLVEYLGHRGPMHHPYRGLRRLFQRHAGEHHRFFTREAMCYESAADLYMVLFPPVLQIFFLGVVAAPLGLLLFWLATPNMAWLWVATAMAYYLSYEILHFCHHLSPDTWLGRRALVTRLRQHHAIHHDPTVMQHANFNITLPLMDWLFGTIQRTVPQGRGKTE